MKIVENKVLGVYFHVPEGFTQMHFLEKVARTCYKSEEKITEDSAPKFLKMLMGRKHMAMFEHVTVSVHFQTSRGVAHEMVRHRLASFAQESSRYCNYSKDKFGSEISVIEPPWLTSKQFKVWKDGMEASEKTYMKLIQLGAKPEIARSVLPTDLKTEIWMTCNFREWLHVFKMRCDNAAHIMIRQIMLDVLDSFNKKLPDLMDDFNTVI